MTVRVTFCSYKFGSWADDHLGEVRPGGAKSYLKDHLGSILNSTPAGAARGFGIWGEPQAATPISASTEPVSYGFTGREHDRESGLNYHRARSLNTSTGTWLSQDPIGLDGGMSLYKYADNRPHIYRDLEGKLSGPGTVACLVLVNSAAGARLALEIKKTSEQMKEIGEKK